MNVPRRAVLIALPALALTACSTAPTGSAPAGAALDFASPTLGGSPFDAATLKGTPVALWFWAPF